MTTKRKYILIGSGITCLLIALMAGVVLNRSYQFHGFIVPPVKHDSHVFLRTEDGPMNLTIYHNKFVLLYFGYTYCPDVCPTSLAKLKIALSELSEAERKKVQVIFISVDPDRDTPQKVNEYAKVFNVDFIGATGTRTEIDLVTESLGVKYKINPPDENGNYSVDHSSYTYVIDPNGYLVMVWSHETRGEEIAEDLTYLIESGIPIDQQLLAGPTPTSVVCSLTLIPEFVNNGRGLYEHNCAQCHGTDLGGIPGWRTPLEDGSHLAPPLGISSVIWEKTEPELIHVINEGKNLDKPMHMPSFKNTLSDEEIYSILQYIYSTWSINQKNYYSGNLMQTSTPAPAITSTPTP
jgi:protein SCO1/2